MLDISLNIVEACRVPSFILYSVDRAIGHSRADLCVESGARDHLGNGRKISETKPLFGRNAELKVATRLESFLMAESRRKYNLPPARANCMGYVQKCHISAARYIKTGERKRAVECSGT